MRLKLASYEIKNQQSYEIKNQQSYEIKNQQRYEIKNQQSYEIKNQQSYAIKNQQSYEIKNTLLCCFSKCKLAVQYKVGLQRLAQLGYQMYTSTVHQQGVKRLFLSSLQCLTSIYVNFACLSVCLLVSNKCQNG